MTDPDIHSVLAEPTPEYDWKIEGIAEAGDRIVVTGGEGAGKSTFLRQICVCSAAGIHPFTLEPVPAIKVLHLDAENSKTFSKREYRPLVELAGDRLGPDQLVAHFRPEGIDLLNAADRAWVEERCYNHLPDLLIIGPLYKLHNQDPNIEGPAKSVSSFLDKLRTTFKFALFIEAHSPYAMQGQARPHRPYGASLWSRWPEFGFHLEKDGTVTHWRGPRDTRDWPVKFTREGAWPWNPVTDEKTILFGRIVAYTIGCPTIPSLRVLEQALGVAKSTIGRCLADNADKWAQLQETHPSRYIG